MFHLLGVHVGGSRIKKRIYQWVVPATRDLAGDLLPSFCLWGAVLVFVAIVPWPLLRSVVWVYLWGALASTRHHGGYSFSSSPGVVHSPPLQLGLGRHGIFISTVHSVFFFFLAIPPSVTHEVQDVLSLAVTPLTVGWSLHILAFLVPVGEMLWVVLYFPSPPCSLWVSSYSIICPHPIRV